MKARKYIKIIIFIGIIGFISSLLISNDALVSKPFSDNTNDLFYKKENYGLKTSYPPNSNYFQYNKNITIDHQKVIGPNNLTNFPMLFSTLDPDLKEVNQSNGNDIAFSDNSTWLDHEIEIFDRDYNETHAQLVAWVRIPILCTDLVNDSYQMIWIYYGNQTMENRQNPLGVWDNNYRGVYHLNNDPSGTIIDSTNHKNGTSAGSMSSNDLVNSQINGGIDFDGIDDQIDFGDWNHTLDFNALYGSLSIWFYAKFIYDINEDAFIVQIYEGSDYRIHFKYDESADQWEFMHELNNTDIRIRTEEREDIALNKWVYMSQTWNLTSDEFIIYINGSIIANETGIYNLTESWLFDRVHLACSRGSEKFYEGILDEFRISNITRDQYWIETEYNNQYSPNTFYSYEIGDFVFIPPLPIYPILLPDPVLALITIFAMMGLMVFLYVKIRVFMVMLVVFLFSLVFGGIAIQQWEIPFSPFLQIFFILFQSIFFMVTSLEAFKGTRKR